MRRNEKVERLEVVIPVAAMRRRPTVGMKVKNGRN